MIEQKESLAEKKPEGAKEPFAILPGKIIPPKSEWGPNHGFGRKFSKPAIKKSTRKKDS